MTSDTSGVSGLSGMTPQASKQLFGAAVVKGTLDVMNSNPFNSNEKNSDYDFQTKVLSAGFALKGNVVDGNV